MTGFVPDFIPDMRKHQNRSGKRAKMVSLKRPESVKKHYLMLKNEETIKLVDTSTEEGRDEFDALYMDKDFDIVGTIDSCLSISDLVKFISVGGI